MLSAGRTRFSSGVCASLNVTDLPSTVRVGACCASPSLAHVRNSSSVVPLPSNELHSTDDPTTNILVPAFTSHEATEVGANGETVLWSRSQHANAAPPVPKEFWALGVSSTAVHSAARLLFNLP